MPNQRTTCLHATNMTIFFVMTIFATVCEVEMTSMYTVDNKMVRYEDVAQYLESSFKFEISFALTYILEGICSVIIGHLIIWYSKTK